MLTRWGEAIQRVTSKDDVWREYPRPQLKRAAWLNLNGLWQYAIAPRTASKPSAWDGEILVPFAVESPLSGVQKSVSIEERVWYQRDFSLPDGWPDQRIILHFGAVDFEAAVWINGAYVGSHRGGFDPFSMDITDFIQPDVNTLTVTVWDPSSLGDQPRGKQHMKPQGIWYTSVTGIWQTVWLEPVGKEAHIDEIRIRSDLSDSSITLDLLIARPTTRQTLAARIRVLDGDTEVAATLMRPDRRITLKIPTVHTWSPQDPHLYDLVAELVPISDPFVEQGEGKEQSGRWPRHGKLEADRYRNAEVTGEALDSVTAYFGMREIKLAPGSHTNQPCLLLNGKDVFHIGPLDQGWWPDGLHTPPSDEAIIYELEFLKAAGFTCLRKHIKVEPARYYYHCDRIGLMVWQDMPCAFAPAQHVAPYDETDQVRKSSSNEQFELELRRMLDHLVNHPSIVMWVIQNEGWGQYDTARLTRWVKDLDPDRVVNSSSGWLDLGVGDVNDKHDYGPTPGLPASDPARAVVMGEYGGIGWPVKGHLWNPEMRNWGYQTYHDQEAVQNAYRQKTEGIVSMRDKVGVCGAIYTQTSDVEGEINGLLTYDRKVEKLPREWLREVHESLTDL
ncbi:MAG: glycoside hydrolase family 2 TIM barrel-domain containing protein [Pseudomonadales bacterium]|jgi:beta-galactosidase/beta-glucuronidase|nr:glycoside hydrolase family 2 TIM barrel-domain containing protein [Pseudomonadales bacterium]